MDADGICDEFEEGGCTDPEACNYDATATDDNGTCSYPEIFVLGDVPTSSIAECSLFADGPNAHGNTYSQQQHPTMLIAARHKRSS